MAKRAAAAFAVSAIVLITAATVAVDQATAPARAEQEAIRHALATATMAPRATALALAAVQTQTAREQAEEAERQANQAKVSEHLAAARDYQAEGQLSLALVELSQTLALAPEHAQARALQQEVRAEATAQQAQIEATAALREARLAATAEVQAQRTSTAEARSEATAQALAARTERAASCPVQPEIANPWCYNFVRGSVITSPPTDFCRYFNCIANFRNGRGHVVQCADGTFSKSGGIRGSCSGHGGNRRNLLAP